MSESQTLSVAERIAENLVQTLKGISPAGGYQIGPLTVERPRHGVGTRAQDNHCLVLQDDPEPVNTAEPYGSQQDMEWLWPFQIHYQAVEREDSVTPIDRRLNIAWADIVKALRVDPHRGNLAIDTIIEAPGFSPYNPQGKSGWVKVNITVHFRHPIDDPYTVS